MSIQAAFHDLLSLEELLQRYHHPTLALSRLLMQPLTGRRPCGSIRLRQPYSSPVHPLLGSLTASRPPPKPKNILGHSPLPFRRHVMYRK